MSPFAEELRKLRLARGFTQQDMADKIGCDRSYLSALENDLKHATGTEFTEKVIRNLGLNETDAESLTLAHKMSTRQYVIPSNAARGIYEFTHEFFERLETLSAGTLQALVAVINSADSSAEPMAEGRLRRKDRGITRGPRNTGGTTSN